MGKMSQEIFEEKKKRETTPKVLQAYFVEENMGFGKLPPWYQKDLERIIWKIPNAETPNSLSLSVKQTSSFFLKDFKPLHFKRPIMIAILDTNNSFELHTKLLEPIKLTIGYTQ